LSLEPFQSLLILKPWQLYPQWLRWQRLVEPDLSRIAALHFASLSLCWVLASDSLKEKAAFLEMTKKYSFVQLYWLSWAAKLILCLLVVSCSPENSVLTSVSKLQSLVHPKRLMKTG
jgi:hypothetical protein